MRTIGFIQPCFMADIAAAMAAPPPGAQAPSTNPAAPGKDAKREAKNERDRLRRKKKRAADAKAAKVAAAKPKKKKAKAKKVAAPRRSAKVARARAQADAMALPTKKKRGRGRPPGAKNKPKEGLAAALVPAPGVIPRSPGRPRVVPPKLEALATTIGMMAPGELAVFQSTIAALNTLPLGGHRIVLNALGAVFK